ncbi:protein YvfG [Aureibacillus halotolerans]|uniref:YvfG protein n=1 Tax=Aureibacillus halotolerans TaxID=1508390 RepID=A0A4R6TUY4_9BACI|nr:protein YvfG [Aureibacillus halotolerans]TDQ36986.1 YvfG protein [Aureibacillus halotolerans]
MNHQLFSVDYFVDSFEIYVKKHNDVKRQDAVNAYYRSVVSTLIQDRLTKNSEIMRRLRNLDEAYTTFTN